jgi:hypothetical protein
LSEVTEGRLHSLHRAEIKDILFFLFLKKQEEIKRCGTWTEVSDCLVSEFFEINTAREAPAVLF